MSFDLKKMFEKNNKSSNILLKVLKNYKTDTPKKTSSNKEIKIKNNNNNFDPIQFIDSITTYEKICILQNLIKEIISIRGRFKKNKKIMLERISMNCKKFYGSQIGMKAIYDYVKSNNPKKHFNYVLEDNNEERFGKKRYGIISKVIFLLRNNNDLLLNLIINCPRNSLEELADFIVNFFFNNTIDSSFNEDELIIIIYLIIEQNFFNEKIKIEIEKKNK